MNVWTVTGHLGQDPRLRTLPSGESVLNMSIGVQKRKKDKDGQWKSETLWVDVSVFGKRAEGLAPMLARGTRVGATGELGVREYTDRDGNHRFALEMQARDVDVLESRQRDSERPAAAQNGGTRPGTNAYQQPRGGYGGGAQREPPQHRDQLGYQNGQQSFGGRRDEQTEYDFGSDDIPF